MKLSTIDKLCCPFDKSELDLHIIAQDLEDNIHEGILSCNTCNRYYPIIKGIPIMSPDEYRELDLEQPVIENWQKQKQLPGITFKNLRLEKTNEV